MYLSYGLFGGSIGIVYTKYLYLKHLNNKYCTNYNMKMHIKYIIIIYLYKINKNGFKISVTQESLVFISLKIVSNIFSFIFQKIRSNTNNIALNVTLKLQLTFVSFVMYTFFIVLHFSRWIIFFRKQGW